MYPILKREEMAQGTVVLNVIEAPEIAAKAAPGQFVMIRANETGERIPLTIAEADPLKGAVTIIYQLVGHSTRLMAGFQEGQGFLDVVGPLGRPTRIEKVDGAVAIVGGGTGVAVIHNITKGFRAAGNRIISIIGARNKDLLIMEERMKRASNRIEICTDDGSCGRRGLVTEALREYLEGPEKIGLVVTAGPAPMMRAVAQLAAEHGVPALASLNAIMIDATGMCGCCRVTVGGQTRLTCVDGPEFDAHQVDWPEFISRLSAYKTQEQQALEYDHQCRIGRGR